VESEPEIQVPDPGGPGTPGQEPVVLATEDEGAGPYKSLLVPLVVVPALIVMVAVLVAVLFGLLSGSESSPRDNLQQLLEGGVNERQQAAFGLVRQILEYQTALGEGREPEWGIDASFLDRLRNAREQVGEPERPGEVWVPFVLSCLLAQLADSGGVDQLLAVTRYDDALDPDFTFRTNAIFVLGSIGEDLAEADRLRVAGAMIGFLDGEDEGLAWLATGALQNLAGPDTVTALQGVLGSRRIDMRLQAALSLAALGDAGGTEVLLELIHPGPYVAERELDGARWAPQTVSISRQKALTALQELGRLPDRATIEAQIEAESDPNVKAKLLELGAVAD
jgi:hypothetical protein